MQRVGFEAVRVLQHERPVVFVRGDISRVHGVECTEKLFEDISFPFLGQVGWYGCLCAVSNSVTAVQASPIGDCAEAEKQRRQAFMISAFRNFILQFSQDLVHNPINRCGTHTVASTDGLLLQMFDDVVNQRELHVVGIRNDEFFATAFRMQGNGS